MKRCTVLVALALLAGGCCDYGARSPSLRAGDPAPDFRLESLDRGRFYLNQQRGRVVVLTFWSTDCSVCRRELVEFEEYSGRVAGKPVSFAAILVDAENSDAARSIVEGLGVSLPVLLDAGGGVAGRYGVTEVPTMFIIDPEGRVCFLRVGYDETAMRQLLGRVDALLEQMP